MPSSTSCSTPPDRCGWSTAPPITPTTSAAFSVTEGASGAAAELFETLRIDPELTAELSSIDHDIERPPDKVLAFYSLMPLLYGSDDTPATSYVCPMHPEVTAPNRGHARSAG